MKLGWMQLVTTNTPGKWDTRLETLEATISYAMFKKMALSESVEIRVGKTSFELREKNLLALRDLKNRVMEATSSN